MIPWILGAAIGVLLAIANFCASIALSSIAIRSSKTISIALLLGTFLVRLLLVFLAFYFVSRVEEIDLSWTLLAFTVCLTILLFCEVWIYCRKVQVSDKTNPPGVRVR